MPGCRRCFRPFKRERIDIPMDPSAQQQACDDFTQLMLTFASAAARCEVHRNRRAHKSDVVVKILPDRIGAATIDARLEMDFGVYLLLGVATPFEVPFKRKGRSVFGSSRRRSSWQQEVSVLCHAVSAGRFCEEVTYLGERAVHSSFVLTLEDGRELRQSWGVRPKLPWRKPRVVTHDYLAYDETAGPPLAVESAAEQAASPRALTAESDQPSAEDAIPVL
jgi:hypothetical protein